MPEQDVASGLVESGFFPRYFLVFVNMRAFSCLFVLRISKKCRIKFGHCYEDNISDLCHKSCCVQYEEEYYILPDSKAMYNSAIHNIIKKVKTNK